MAEFENYKEVAFLLSKAVQGQLTEKEEETLGRWRQEFPGRMNILYRQVLTSEFVISKSKTMGTGGFGDGLPKDTAKM